MKKRKRASRNVAALRQMAKELHYFAERVAAYEYQGRRIENQLKQFEVICNATSNYLEGFRTLFQQISSEKFASENGVGRVAPSHPTNLDEPTGTTRLP